MCHTGHGFIPLPYALLPYTPQPQPTVARSEGLTASTSDFSAARL